MRPLVVMGSMFRVGFPLHKSHMAHPWRMSEEEGKYYDETTSPCLPLSGNVLQCRLDISAKRSGQNPGADNHGGVKGMAHSAWMADFWPKDNDGDDVAGDGDDGWNNAPNLPLLKPSCTTTSSWQCPMCQEDRQWSIWRGWQPRE